MAPPLFAARRIDAMFRFDRQSPTGAASGIVRSAAPYVLAAALQAAFAVWPCAAPAQQQMTAGASAVPVNDRQSDTLSAAARQQQSDEERMLGGPSTSGNPYSVRPYDSNGASPEDAEDALTNEKHMHVSIPTGAAEAGSAGGADSGGASRGGGRSATSRSRIGPNGISRAGNAMTQRMAGSSTRKGAAGYDFGANATSRTSNIYGNPYGSPYASPDQANADLYKSPW
jgi:hypothetical protein